MSSLVFREDVQGLRAIAVLAVIAFHFNPMLLPGGFVGVDVFLVISGFLITSILLSRKNKVEYQISASLRYFYISRFKRIVPAYFVMLLLVALCASVLFLPKDFSGFNRGLEQAALFKSNGYFADLGDYFAPSNFEQPLLHTWSLAVEIQFYILAPLLVLLLPIRILQWVFVILLISLTIVAEYRLRILGLEQSTYYSLYARLPEFFAGGLTAIYVGNRKPSETAGHNVAIFGLTLILVSAAYQPEFGLFPGTSALLPTIGTALVLSRPATGLMKRILQSKILIWVGGLSYSLYLWHWPILAFLRYYTGEEILNIGCSIIFIVLTLGFSLVSFYLIEQFYRSRKSKNRSLTAWGVLAVNIVLVSSLLTTINNFFTPPQLPIELRRYADPAKICHGSMVDDCIRGDLTSNREILVLGDSHAAMLNHFIDYLGNRIGFKARVITSSNCVTIPEFDHQEIPEYSQRKCINQIKEVEEILSNYEMVWIAGAWSYQFKRDSFKSAISSFFDRNLDKDIYIFSQIPKFVAHIERVYRFQGFGFNVDDLDKDGSYKLANRSLEDIAMNYENVTYISLDEIELFEYAPFFEGERIYMDRHHLNEKGSRLYALNSLPIIQTKVSFLKSVNE